MMARVGAVGLLVGLMIVAHALGAAQDASMPDTDLYLMPMPAEVATDPGRLPLPQDLVVVVVGARQPRLLRGVARLLDRLDLQSGGAVRGRIDPAAPALVTVRAMAASEAVPQLGEDESYHLTVNDAGVQLVAPTTLGALRGLETLLQLVDLDGDGFGLPYVRIADRPRFPWRGLLIDVCRHWMPAEVIKRNLDAMAAVKLNVLHWHLTEDQGFRIESKRYPRLHEMGSNGHYFTQEQVRDIVAYAADRGIRVVPEFDIPAHTTSWFVGHPELASLPGPYAIETTWGIMDPAIDPTRDEVYELLAGFLQEMAALFPDPYLHIGGDEVNGNQWNANPAIQDYIARHDLLDNHGLQAHFNLRINQILAANGKRMAGWEEIIHPDLPHSAVVQSWRNEESLIEALSKGYGTILSRGYYLDLMHSAAEHYGVDPLPPEVAAQLTGQQQQLLLGGEACMWSELVTAETIDSRIWPRAAAIAERLWSPAAVNDVESMYGRLERTSRWLVWTGVQHRANYRPMLERLAGDRPIEALQVLADVLVPPRDYERHDQGEYTTATPMIELADAARPESATARHFATRVQRFLELRNPADADAIRAALIRWRDQHPRLRQLLATSAPLRPVEPVSADLAALAEVGLHALGWLQGIESAPPADPGELVARAKTPRASLRIAVAAPIARLWAATSNDSGSDRETPRR